MTAKETQMDELLNILLSGPLARHLLKKQEETANREKAENTDNPADHQRHHPDQIFAIPHSHQGTNGKKKQRRANLLILASITTLAIPLVIWASLGIIAGIVALIPAIIILDTAIKNARDIKAIRKGTPFTNYAGTWRHDRVGDNQGRERLDDE